MPGHASGDRQDFPLSKAIGVSLAGLSATAATCWLLWRSHCRAGRRLRGLLPQCQELPRGIACGVDLEGELRFRTDVRFESGCGCGPKPTAQLKECCVPA